VTVLTIQDEQRDLLLRGAGAEAVPRFHGRGRPVGAAALSRVVVTGGSGYG
jgi:hypothetical protein